MIDRHSHQPGIITVYKYEGGKNFEPPRMTSSTVNLREISDRELLALETCPEVSYEIERRKEERDVPGDWSPTVIPLYSTKPLLTNEWPYKTRVGVPTKESPVYYDLPATPKNQYEAMAYSDDEFERAAYKETEEFLNGLINQDEWKKLEKKNEP